MSSDAAVLLLDPKYPHNVGGSLRACANLNASILRWTGDRVDDYKRMARSAPPMPKRPSKWRLPREERMKDTQHVSWGRLQADLTPLYSFRVLGYTPVCVEFMENAEQLPDFVHPEQAVYVFGPEDGDVPKGIKVRCERFVRIPSRHCLNLAAAVHLVLYDRNLKLTHAVTQHPSYVKDGA